MVPEKGANLRKYQKRARPVASVQIPVPTTQQPTDISYADDSSGDELADTELPNIVFDDNSLNRKENKRKTKRKENKSGKSKEKGKKEKDIKEIRVTLTTETAHTLYTRFSGFRATSKFSLMRSVSSRCKTTSAS